MEPAEQLIGRLPDWLELGPEQEINGQKVREVLGDWSHRAPCDRPPKYLVEGFFTGGLSEADRSAVRPPVRCSLPGLDIGLLRGTEKGKCAILFNGASLQSHDLYQVKCPIIGMNRTHLGWPSYNGPQPDYLCLIDYCWFQPPFREHVLRHPKVINGSTHPDSVGYRVPRSSRMKPFSFDLKRDGYVGPVPCTTGHLALQLAVYLGFDEIYCLGWDLQGPHFDGTASSKHLPDALRYHKRQKEKLDEAGVGVYLCNPASKLANVFEVRSFQEVCI